MILSRRFLKMIFDHFLNIYHYLHLGSEKNYLKLYYGDFLESFVKSKQQFRLLCACSDKTSLHL